MEMVLFVVAIPLAAIIWFIYDVAMFVKCPKEQVEKRKRKFWAMIGSGTVVVFYVGVLIGLMVLLSSAVEHM